MMKAIFLDRDGTIIKDKNYLSNPNEVEWLPHALEALLMLKNKGYELFLITNQSGIGRGFFSLKDLSLVHEKIESKMSEEGIGHFLAIEYCPHTPEDNCSCRKPKTVMLDKICHRYPIDKSQSWMVGDKDIDALSGKNAGLQFAIIGQTYSSWAKDNGVALFDDLLHFAQYICHHRK